MRVEQHGTFLLDIIRDVADGNCGLAPFQRAYAWEKEDVEKLMLSILRKWPVGSFTLWSPRREEQHDYVSRGRIGPIEHSPDASTLILDGQNRLASLVFASFIPTSNMTPETPYSDQELKVWFGSQVLVADAEQKRVVFVDEANAWSPTRAPFGEIMNATIFRRGRPLDVFDRMRSFGMSDHDLNWMLDDLPDFVRASRVTTTNLLNASYEEAKECYLTICRAGQPISEEEFEAAFNHRPPMRAATTPRP